MTYFIADLEKWTFGKYDRTSVINAQGLQSLHSHSSKGGPGFT